MFSSGQGSFKVSCNGKCFWAEVEPSQKPDDEHTEICTQTIVPSGHSGSYFYLKSQISINAGFDCFGKIAAGLVPTHLCGSYRALWIDYTSSLFYTLCDRLSQQTTHIFRQTWQWKSQSQLYSHSASYTNPTANLLLLECPQYNKKERKLHFVPAYRVSFPFWISKHYSNLSSLLTCRNKVDLGLSGLQGYTEPFSMVISLWGCLWLASMSSQVLTGVWKRDTCLAMCWFSDPFTRSCGQRLCGSQNMPSH